MSTKQGLRNPSGMLSVPATLAHLLDVLDHRPRGANATQYRAVATSLAQELTRLDQATLDALLSSSPAAAEIYENQHYAHAGLCRSDLDQAMQAELQAKAVIGRAAQRQAKRPRPQCPT
jgi:hypothetical protein